MAGDVLDALRLATRTRHELLDSSLAVSAAAPTLASYQAHLAGLHAWLLPIEAWLAQFDDGPQDPRVLEQVRRSHLLEQDLASLPAGEAVRPIALPFALQAAAAYRWGVCYVIEGAQLGGEVLHRRLAGLPGAASFHYLSSDGAGPGMRWRAFMQVLREQVDSPEKIDAACAGSVAAFDHILAIFRLEHEGRAMP